MTGIRGHPQAGEAREAQVTEMRMMQRGRKEERRSWAERRELLSAFFWAHLAVGSRGFCQESSAVG